MSTINIILLNKCCGSYLKEANLVAAEFIKIGRPARVSIRHKDQMLIDRYHLDINKIPKGYIIIEDFDIVFEASKVKDVQFMANIVNSLSFLDRIEKKTIEAR